MAKTKQDKVEQQLKETNSKIVRLGAIAEKLGAKNLESLDDLKDINSSSGDLKSKESKQLSADIKSLFEKNLNGVNKDRKFAKKQLEVFKNISSLISDDSEKEIINKQISAVDKLIKNNDSTFSKLSGVVGQMIPGLVGVVGALGSNSPIVGLMAAKGVELLKERSEKKKQLKETSIQHATAMRTEQQLIKDKLELSKKSDDKKVDVPVVENNTSKENNKEQENINSLSYKKVEDNTKGILDELFAVRNDTSSKENLIEQRQIDKENTDRIVDSIKNSISSIDSEVSGLNSNSIFEKIKGIRTVILGFFTGIVGHLTKFIKFVPKILKKIPILGAIISGGLGIFNSISNLPDDATISETLIAGIKGLANGVMDFFVGIPVMLIDFITGSDISGFIDSEGGYLNVIGNSISKIITTVKTFISDLWESVSNFVSKSVRELSNGLLGVTATNYLLGEPVQQQKTNNKIKHKFPSGLDLINAEENYQRTGKIKSKRVDLKSFKVDLPDVSPNIIKKEQQQQTLNTTQQNTNRSINISAPVNNIAQTSNTTMVGARPTIANTLKINHRKTD